MLSGGGARGAFHVGVWEELSRHPRFGGRRMVLSGTSAGAINAALIATGRSPAEMMAFWDGLAADLPVEATDGLMDSIIFVLAGLTVTESFNWAGTLGAARFFLTRAIERFPPWPGRLLGTGIEYLLTKRFDLVTRFIESVQSPCLVDTRRLRQRLVDALGGEHVRSADHDLAISAVDANRGEVVRWVSRQTPHTTSAGYVFAEDGISVDMVLASASIPVLFPPAMVGARRMWDGGLLVNTPLAPVVALDADEIVTVLVTELGTERERLERLGQALERAVDALLENSYQVDRKLLLDRNRLASVVREYREVLLYRPIRPGGEACFNVGAFLNFDAKGMGEMREAGRRAAGAWLAGGPPVDALD